MSKEKFAGVKGMNDMLPADAAVWQTLQQTAVGVLERYGYQEIRTPILENTKVFTRGVGEVTDHCGKGDVLLHRQHERRPADAAPRMYVRCRARSQ